MGKKDCIFCKIVAGEIPCHKVYEDDDFLGFLDIHPLEKGHALLVPKKHYRWVDEVPEFGKYWETAKKVGLFLKKNLMSKAVFYLTVGLQVSHAHIHIVPRFSLEGGFDIHKTKEISQEELKEIASKIGI